MATEEKSDGLQQTETPPASNFGARVVDQYRKLKEHAEAYPYVWGSYIVVYGGFGLYLAYRVRKLRQTEDRVRNLQERLRKLAKTTEPVASSSTASTSSATSPSTNAASKTTDK
ncbi:hypothetical protein LINGRAHAP2_LOCUS29892 [Linum grandiflorum]